MFYLVINLKAYQTFSEAKNWIATVSKRLVADRGLKIIISPSAAHLCLFQHYRSKFNLPFELSAQNISQYRKGGYTGEIVADSLQELVNYTIIGHSERRRLFLENNQELGLKVKIALKTKITPIYCISDRRDPVPSAVRLVAYEPTRSIGTGNNLPVNELRQIKEQLGLRSYQLLLYGGSVSQTNIGPYIHSQLISGFLIASAALNPTDFLTLTKAITNLLPN